VNPEWRLPAQATLAVGLTDVRVLLDFDGPQMVLASFQGEPGEWFGVTADGSETHIRWLFVRVEVNEIAALRSGRLTTLAALRKDAVRVADVPMADDRVGASHVWDVAATAVPVGCFPDPGQLLPGTAAPAPIPASKQWDIRLWQAGAKLGEISAQALADITSALQGILFGEAERVAAHTTTPRRIKKSAAQRARLNVTAFAEGSFVVQLQPEDPAFGRALVAFEQDLERQLDSTKGMRDLLGAASSRSASHARKLLAALARHGVDMEMRDAADNAYTFIRHQTARRVTRELQKANPVELTRRPFEMSGSFTAFDVLRGTFEFHAEDTEITIAGVLDGDLQSSEPDALVGYGGRYFVSGFAEGTPAAQTSALNYVLRSFQPVSPLELDDDDDEPDDELDNEVELD